MFGTRIDQIREDLKTLENGSNTAYLTFSKGFIWD